MAEKKVECIIKLQVPAGAAKPGSDIGTALGPRGVNMVEFCKQFNERSKNEKVGCIVPVVMQVYKDKSFTFIVKSPPTAVQIKDVCSLDKGSAEPNKTKVATLTKDQLETIAKSKIGDMTASCLQQAKKTVAGTARSMGVQIEAGALKENA